MTSSWVITIVSIVIGIGLLTLAFSRHMEVAGALIGFGSAALAVLAADRSRAKRPDRQKDDEA